MPNEEPWDAHASLALSPQGKLGTVPFPSSPRSQTRGWISPRRTVPSLERMEQEVWVPPQWDRLGQRERPVPKQNESRSRPVCGFPACDKQITGQQVQSIIPLCTISVTSLFSSPYPPAPLKRLVHIPAPSTLAQSLDLCSLASPHKHIGSWTLSP